MIGRKEVDFFSIKYCVQSMFSRGYNYVFLGCLRGRFFGIKYCLQSVFTGGYTCMVLVFPKLESTSTAPSVLFPE